MGGVGGWDGGGGGAELLCVIVMNQSLPGTPKPSKVRPNLPGRDRAWRGKPLTGDVERCDAALRDLSKRSPLPTICVWGVGGWGGVCVCVCGGWVGVGVCVWGGGGGGGAGRRAGALHGPPLAHCNLAWLPPLGGSQGGMVGAPLACMPLWRFVQTLLMSYGEWPSLKAPFVRHFLAGRPLAPRLPLACL